MEIKINIEKRHVTFLLSGMAFIFLAGVVLAAFGSVPNPGHAVSELQTCDTEGSILKMVGGEWGCAIDEGSGATLWGDIQDIPAGFADGIDNVGISSWGDIQDIPAGFADGIDDIGITSESDPQVGSLTANRWCRASTTQVVCDRSAPLTTLDIVENDCELSPSMGAGWKRCDCDLGYKVTGWYGYNCENDDGEWGCWATQAYGTTGMQFYYSAETTAYVGVYCARLI